VTSELCNVTLPVLPNTDCTGARLLILPIVTLPVDAPSEAGRSKLLVTEGRGCNPDIVVSAIIIFIE
jgi:hypothetical protein